MQRSPSILPLLVLAVAANAAASSDDWLATPTRAYAAMPPTAVTDGKVSRVSWSPDGEHLLVVERPITTSREQLLRFDGSTPGLGGLELLGWDRKFHQVKRLWSADDRTATIEAIDWLKGTASALITVRWVVRDGPQSAQRPLYGLLAMDTGSGKFRWVAGMEQLVSRPHVAPSPTRPVAAVVFADNPEVAEAQPQSLVFSLSADGNDTSNGVLKVITAAVEAEVITLSRIVMESQPLMGNNFWTLDAGGNVVHAIKTPKELNLPLVWNADGSAWFLIDTDPTTKKPVLARLTDQGMLEPTSEQQFVAKETERELDVESTSATAKHGKTTVNHENLWLVSSKPVEHGEMLLTPNGEWPELSPTNSGVFYVDGGVAKVMELIPLTARQQKSALTEPKTASAVNFTGTFRVLLDAAGRQKSTPPE
ncbi:MAG TPA: hypothetical protein VKT78_18990 [Fimbriimonadaceae bacterium]|nr:hypothetical protein [Fimbriimonadaceae bacterium]